MGFTDKTPQYQACLKFIEAISPKHGTKHTEVVDLTSPTDEHMADNNNETPLINENEKKQKIDDNDLQDDEEHNKQEEEPSKEWKWSNTQKSHGDSKIKKLQRSHVDPKTQFVFIIFISRGNVIRHGPTKLRYQYLFVYMFYVNVCYNHTYGWSTDPERSSLKHRPNDRSKQELTLVPTSCFISFCIRKSVCRSIRILELQVHTLRFDKWLERSRYWAFKLHLQTTKHYAQVKKTAHIRTKPWIVRLPFKVYGAVMTWKKWIKKTKLKKIFLNFTPHAIKSSKRSILLLLTNQ